MVQKYEKTTVEIPQRFFDSIIAGRLNDAARDVIDQKRAVDACPVPNQIQKLDMMVLVYHMADELDSIDALMEVVADTLPRANGGDA